MKYQIISLKYFFAVKGAIYRLAIIAVMIYGREDNMLFSRVQIIIMCLDKSSPGISLVFILINEGFFFCLT